MQRNLYTMMGITGLIIGTALQSFYPSLAEQKTYQSFCARNDNACIEREQAFMAIMKRQPATDSEIMDVYQQDPFNGAEVRRHTENLPQWVTLEDN